MTVPFLDFLAGMITGALWTAIVLSVIVYALHSDAPKDVACGCEMVGERRETNPIVMMVDQAIILLDAIGRRA